MKSVLADCRDTAPIRARRSRNSALRAASHSAATSAFETPPEQILNSLRNQGNRHPSPPRRL